MTNLDLHNLLSFMDDAESADYYYTAARLREEMACNMAKVTELRRYALAHKLIQVSDRRDKYALTDKGRALARSNPPSKATTLVPVDPGAARAAIRMSGRIPVHTRVVALEADRDAQAAQIEALRVEIAELRALLFGLEIN